MLGTLATASILLAVAEDERGQGEDVMSRFHLLRGLGDLPEAWATLFRSMPLEEGVRGHAILEALAKNAAESDSLDEAQARMRELVIANEVARRVFVDPVRDERAGIPYVIPGLDSNSSFYGDASRWFRVIALIDPAPRWAPSPSWRPKSYRPQLRPYATVRDRPAGIFEGNVFALPGEVFRFKPTGRDTIESMTWSWDDERALVGTVVGVGDPFVLVRYEDFIF